MTLADLSPHLQQLYLSWKRIQRNIDEAEARTLTIPKDEAEQFRLAIEHILDMKQDRRIIADTFMIRFHEQQEASVARAVD